jgi:broad specificity phosphatase PhoE
MRHGRSAHPYPNRWITPAEFRDWIALYNRTGIADDSHPPDGLLGAIGDVQAVVCSDYPRSTESAARLFPNHQPIVSALFREVGRPWQGSQNIRLPLSVWDGLSVLLWNLNVITGDESIRAARQRAQAATRELIALAERFSHVLFVGHGMMNRLIGRELRLQGWRGPRRANDGSWGVVSYLSPT